MVIIRNGFAYYWFVASIDLEFDVKFQVIFKIKYRSDMNNHALDAYTQL